MSEWLNSKESNTYPPYRFKLVNPETAQFVNLGVDSEPLEWASGIIELNRRIKVGGVFTSFAVSSLTFIKEGANFVRSIWTEKEFNGKCDLHVYWFKNSTRDYVEFPSSFALNFATCKPKKKIGKNAIGLNIEAINSDVLTKLDNRSDTDVDVTKTTTIGGVDIIDYGESGAGFTYQDLRKNINFPAYTIINSTQSRLPSSADGSTLPRLSGQISYCSVPVRTVLSDFDEIGDVVHVTRKTSLADVNSIFDTALVDYSFTFSYSVTVNVTDKHSVNPWTLKLIETDSLGAIVNENVFDSFGTIKQNYFLSGSSTVTISAGNSFKFVIEVGDYADIAAELVYYQTQLSPFTEYYTEAFFKQTVANSDAATTESFPLYEAFERVLQHNLDVQFPFYSEYLGRPECVYNLDGDTYATESQLRHFNVMSGLNVRGLALSNNDNPLAINFDKLYDSSSSILNLGMAIEVIDDFTRVRVEEYAHFFDDTEVLDISARISTYDIESEAMPELAYFKVKSGFKDFDYEEINGRGEYNTEALHTTIIETDTEFDNVCDLRGDTKEFIDLLTSPIIQDGTKDEKSDNDIFILKTQEDGDDWKPETDENIAINNDTSIFGVNSMNLYITPLRNLIRNSCKIKASLTKFLASYVRFQTSKKLQTLETTGEGETWTENQNVLVDDLNDPIYKPIKHTVECKFTYDDFVLIQANMFGLIRFSSTLTGYLLNLKKKNNEDKAIITIIEKYS